MAGVLAVVEGILNICPCGALIKFILIKRQTKVKEFLNYATIIPKINPFKQK